SSHGLSKSIFALRLISLFLRDFHLCVCHRRADVSLLESLSLGIDSEAKFRSNQRIRFNPSESVVQMLRISEKKISLLT
ncbi:MAG: hypothetical protein DRI57_22835, partial [Deltaproteobacteria bacterium]